MSFEIIGVATIFLGIFCLFRGPVASIHIFFMTTLLGSAAATKLTAVGGASIPPAHVLLFFLALQIALSPSLLSSSIAAFVGFRAGFWLLLTVIYGVLSACIMPRLFFAELTVYIVGSSDISTNSFVEMPLGPVSGNITQSIYLCGDLVCFAVFAAYSCAGSRLRQIGLAGLACAFLNIGLAGLDLATYWTGTADAMNVIRNAGYRMLGDAEIAGIKRIVGSFTEASAFAYMTLGLLAFTTTLWLRGVHERASGLAALLSVVCLIFTTSTTGYVSLAVLVLVQLVMGLWRIAAGRPLRHDLTLVVVVPIMAIAVAMVLWLSAPVAGVVERVFELTVADKLQSQSGVERSSWNQKAIAAFVSTDGLGAGIGSVRASSWVAAVMSNIGIFGSATMAAFIASLLFGGSGWSRRGEGSRQAEARGGEGLPSHEAEAVRSACRAACVALLVAASTAGSFVDLGLPFFLYAGAASGRPLPRPLPSRRFGFATRPGRRPSMATK